MSEETATITTESEGGETPSIFSDGYTLSDGFAEQLGIEGVKPESISKFAGKSINDVFKSYAELQSKIGQKTEGMVKIPGEDATDEDRQAFYAALGVPESPDGYEVELPEAFQDLDWNPDSLGPIKEVAHKVGVSPAQLNALVAAQAEIEKAQLDQWQQESEEAVSELRGEWGADYDKNLTLAKRAAQAAGLDSDNVTDPEMLKAFALSGRRFRKGNLVPLRRPRTAMTAEAEAREIQTNPDHPLYLAYRGEVADRQKIEAARKKVSELLALASKE